MKKIILIIILLTINYTVAQNNNNTFMFDGVFNLEYSDNVKIKIGNAIKNQHTNKWKKGSKVGKHIIKPELFKKLKEKTSKKVRIQIFKKKKIGTLHKMILTDLKTNKKINGIFDERNNKFIVGKNKGKKRKNTDINKLDVFKGKLNFNKTKIINGKFESSLFITTKSVVFTVNATFSFTGLVD